jgi:lambda family phage portal protein
MKTTLTIVDRAINTLFPEWGFRRLQYKHAIEVSKRAYDGAAGGRRTEKWKAPATSAGAEITSALLLLRNRSRELVRNNPYASKAVAELANNITGTGIMPTPITDSKPTAKKIKQAWKAWADSTDADFDGHLNYYGIAHLAARTMVESGDCIIRKHIVSPKDYAFPLQLQVLEGDYIDSTKYQDKTADGGYIYYGVEFNKDHKVIAYWLWSTHPGDNIQYNQTSTRVPATELIYLFIKLRPGQFRGVPLGHASMLRLKDFDEYEDAQLIRQKIAQCFTLFVQDNNLSNTIPGMKTDHEMIERVEPGIIEDLPPGKTITSHNPPDAGANYEMYTKGVLRGVAAGYNMDYVTLTGDLTGVNFSSGRMGWLQFHRNISVMQWLNFIPTFSNRSWQWFMQIAVVMGYSKTQMVAVTWTPPRREMIDPTKETTAQIEAIRGGLTSWQETARENGYNPEDLREEMRQDKEAFDAIDILPESDPRYDKPVPPALPGEKPPKKNPK